MPHTEFHRSEAEWIELSKECGAYAFHDYNPKRPHFLLTSKEDGKDHSDGFHDWLKTGQYPTYAREATEDLALKFTRQHYHLGRAMPDRVVGPGYGAITLADRLAEAFTDQLGYMVKFGFTEKKKDGIIPVRLVESNDLVLACEDTITSGTSVLHSIEAIEKTGAGVMPVVLCICNRSGLKSVDGIEIISLIDTPMERWTAEECKLCKLGSEAIRPKTPAENWLRLTQPYD